MKLIKQARTESLLQEWAGNSELIIASLFFWYAGSRPQKSQVGLLHSLLHTVLSRRPELIILLFPNVCRSIVSGQLKDNIDFIELTFVELSAAFRILMQELSEGIKVCLMVDGIDGYEGDHQELTDLFADISGCERVKVIISSRLIPACVCAFRSFPKLRLQDLNHPDISNYVQAKLCNDDMMEKIGRRPKGSSPSKRKSP